MRKRLFLMTLCLLLLAACGGGRRYDMLMHEADSLLTAGDAATAYTLLAAADSQKTAWSRKHWMAYELQKAQAQNLAYVDFQTDSVLRIVARFYDSHGKPNDRLRAHYLLGCTYRDLHEAPLAILSWEDAIACADTTAADCDYATLFRVYGQMADVYFRQFMPEKQLEAENLFCKYALLAGDTLNYMRGLLKKNDAYLLLGDTTAIFQNVQYVRKLYLDQGLTAEAARVYPTAITIALDNGQYARARSMMETFEKESGLFDKQGNIAKGYEKYYYNKARYFMVIHRLDSAEILFHHLMYEAGDVVDACQGLLAIYKEKNEVDSIHKYVGLYEKALAQYLKETKTTAITQAEGMYDYHRHERIAQEQKEKTHQRDLFLTIVISLFCFAIIRTYLYIQKQREEKERVINKLTEDYALALKNQQKAKKEISLLQQSLIKTESAAALLQEKLEEIQFYEEQVKALQKQIASHPDIIHNQQIEESRIIQHLHQIAHSHLESNEKGMRRIKARAANSDEWQELIEAIRLCHPSFYLFIQKHKLSSLKSKVCILTRYGFDNQEIATLSGANAGSVPNARTSLAKTLFGLDSARELDSHLQDI